MYPEFIPQVFPWEQVYRGLFIIELTPGHRLKEKSMQKVEESQSDYDLSAYLDV
jgi:hypothetical protein